MKESEIVRSRVLVWTREIQRLQANVALGLKWLKAQGETDKVNAVKNTYKKKPQILKNQ